MTTLQILERPVITHRILNNGSAEVIISGASGPVLAIRGDARALRDVSRRIGRAATDLRWEQIIGLVNNPEQQEG